MTTRPAANRKATIADVAHDCGVSSATVSRALRHPELVSPPTIEAIRNSIQKLGYAGSALRDEADTLSRPDVLVVVIPWLDNPFYNDIIRGIRVAAKARGIEIIIKWGAPKEYEVKKLCALLVSCHAVGAIILCPLSNAALEQIQSYVPVVQCCECNESSSVPFVTIDDVASAKAATEHLISCGCKHPAFLCGPLEYKYARDRLSGFTQVVEAHGLSVPESHVVSIPKNNYDLAYPAVVQMLEGAQRPDGIFACSDVYAVAVIRAAHKAGIAVPEELKVVGFDNIDISLMTTPTITTVSQPRYRMGFSACNVLLEQINAKDQDAPSQKRLGLYIETELIVRESTSQHSPLLA